MQESCTDSYEILWEETEDINKWRATHKFLHPILMYVCGFPCQQAIQHQLGVPQFNLILTPST